MNSDGIEDAALTLSLDAAGLEKFTAMQAEEYSGPPYIVVVLFADSNSAFKRFAVNGRLYPAATGDGPLDLKIAKGILVTNQNYRDGDAVDVTFRFRYDAASGKLMLIGFDLENYSRTNIYEGHKTSDNFLTGKRIEFSKNDGPPQRRSTYEVIRRTQIPLASISFEQARFNDDDGDINNIRPFGPGA